MNIIGWCTTFLSSCWRKITSQLKKGRREQGRWWERRNTTTSNSPHQEESLLRTTCSGPGQMENFRIGLYRWQLPLTVATVFTFTSCTIMGFVCLWERVWEWEKKKEMLGNRDKEKQLDIETAFVITMIHIL